MQGVQQTGKWLRSQLGYRSKQQTTAFDAWRLWRGVCVLLWAAAVNSASAATLADQIATVPADLPPLSLSDTAVVSLPDSQTGRQYEVWLSFPAHYDARKKYPLLVVTDAEYAFPLVRSIRKRLGAGGQNIQDFLLVGLSYSQGDSAVDSRNRDYTPIDVQAPGFSDGNKYGGRQYGEGAAYSRYVTQQVMPYLLKNWPVDAKHTVFVGHSFGALLGSQILLQAPTTFTDYVLSSPSFWFGKREMFQREQAYANTHQDLPAQVWFYAASFEQVGPTARHTKRISIVLDTEQMKKRLASRRYPSFKQQYQVIEGEDHLSVFPMMISDAMLKILPGTGPYTPG